MMNVELGRCWCACGWDGSIVFVVIMLHRTLPPVRNSSPSTAAAGEEEEAKAPSSPPPPQQEQEHKAEVAAAPASAASGEQQQEKSEPAQPAAASPPSPSSSGTDSEGEGSANDTQGNGKAGKAANKAEPTPLRVLVQDEEGAAVAAVMELVRRSEQLGVSALSVTERQEAARRAKEEVGGWSVVGGKGMEVKCICVL